MQVSVESISPLERRMTVTMPATMLDEAYNEEITRLAKKTKIDGFRPGKVPRTYIESRFGSQAHIEALNKVIQKGLSNAFIQEKTFPVNQPRVEPKSIERGQSIEFDAFFEVMPTIETVHFNVPTLEKITAVITEEDIDLAIQRLREHHQVADNAALLTKLHMQESDFDKLKSEIRTHLENQLSEIVRSNLTQQLCEKLLEQNNIDVPPSLIQQEAEQIHRGAHGHQQCDGHSHSEEEKNSLQQLAKRKVTLGFLMGHLVKQHQIILDKERLNTFLTKLAGNYESPTDMLKWLEGNKNAMAQFEAKILEEQLIEKLLENVQLTEKTVSYSELLAITH